MAMTAAALPQLRLQQRYRALSATSTCWRHPSSVTSRNKPSFLSTSLQWKLHLRRPHNLVPQANANTVPVQEEQAQPSFSPEEEDEANCREILRVLDILKDKRDMSFNEVRLTILIEDPSEEERREQFNVENERGCSREDLASALVDVFEGRMPSDRTVLRELAKEMTTWPNLEDEAAQSNPLQSPYAKSTVTGVDPRVIAQKMNVDFDAAAEVEPGEESESASVPPVVGFSFLYLVSVIPILIGIGVVAVLYLNSFR